MVVEEAEEEVEVEEEEEGRRVMEFWERVYREIGRERIKF